MPVSMMWARSVMRSNTALHNRALGMTCVHSENGKLVVNNTADRSKAFGQMVDLSRPEMIKAISTPVAGYLTVKTFAGALRGLVVEELTPTLEGAGRKLSETEGFPFSRPTFTAEKTIFNLVAADNEFERDFARFLEDSEGVSAFAKLPPTSRLPFSIEYTDNATNLRYNEPDFVTVLIDGTHLLVETKGREDIDVVHKDRAAGIWCENATLLTGTPWSYVKVPQTEFVKLQPRDFSELFLAFGQGRNKYGLPVSLEPMSARLTGLNDGQHSFVTAPIVSNHMSGAPSRGWSASAK